MTHIQIADFTIGTDRPLALIAGPCAIESAELCLEVAQRLAEICGRLEMPLIFKASYDKANRSSLNAFRGPGLEIGLEVLATIRDQVNLPVYTDVHTPEEAIAAAKVCAALQIPAFLCRQTDLIVRAAQTGCPLTIKKGQFMAPWDMRAVVQKVRGSGNHEVMLIDRGTSFGYNNLVSDMRAIPIMHEAGGCPVCFDATHSVQLPGGHGTHSGGQAEFVQTLALAAVASGADALFLECHPRPTEAKSDAGSQLPLEQVEALLAKAQAIRSIVQESHVHA